MNRGDIYWVNLDPTQGSKINKLRPCVIVSATPINKARRTVVVVPLSTSAKPRPPLVISIHCLDKAAVMVCDQTRAIDKSRLVKLAGTISAKDLQALEDGLRQVLSL
jgi:mRNA interferase MazF